MDLQQELTELKTRGLTFDACVKAFGVHRDDNPFAKAAWENSHQDGTLEIDQVTVLSESDEGAYVMAWVWVGNGDAGIQTGIDDDNT